MLPTSSADTKWALEFQCRLHFQPQVLLKVFFFFLFFLLKKNKRFSEQASGGGRWHCAVPLWPHSSVLTQRAVSRQAWGKAGSRRVLAGSLSSSLYGIKGNVSGTTFVCAFQPGLWSESCQSGCKWEYAMEGRSGHLRDIYCLCCMEWQEKKEAWER